MQNVPIDQITDEHSVYLFLSTNFFFKLIKTNDVYQWINIFGKTFITEVAFKTIQKAIEDLSNAPDIELHVFITIQEAKDFVKSKL